LVVLHSCPIWLPPTQVWLYNQIRALPQDIESHIACIGLSAATRFPLPNIHSLGGDSPLFYRVEAALRNLGWPIQPHWLRLLARRHDVALLHSHFGNMGWLNLPVARSRHLPHVVTFYGLDVDHLPQQDKRWSARYLELFAQTDAVLCEGPHMAARIVARGCPAAKVHVHHLGVDTAAIPFRPRRHDPSSPLRVLIAGAFREKKGIPLALAALGRLRAKVQLEVTIIGDAGTEPRERLEKQRIQAALGEHGLTASTHLLGFQPHETMMAHAYQHHIFISPSLHAADGDSEGGAPVSITEMAASGMPVVSTRHCDIPEVIGNGLAAQLLAPEKDVDALTERLFWLVDHQEAWPELTLEVRRRIECEFDMAAQGGRLAQLYRSLIARGRTT